MRQNTMLGGTAILAAVSLINRIAAFAFRAFLVRAVGQEALGLYQMAFSLYTSIAGIATAGISIGVAKITTDHRQRGNQGGIGSTLKSGCVIALLTGFVSMLALFLSRGIIAVDLLKDERTLLPLLALIPALPIIALAGALRGYCQGMRYMSLVALGFFLEQAAHIVLSVMLILRLASSPLTTMAAGLSLGYTGGELVGLLSLVAAVFLTLRHAKKRAPMQFGPLIGMVGPVAAGRIFLALSATLNNILLPRSLRFMGYSAGEAAIAYGQLTGMAVNVLFLPAVLTFPLANNLLPAIAESTHSSIPTQKQRYFLRGLRYSLLLGLPASALFVAVGPELCDVLFGVPEAGKMLSLLGWVAWLVYLQHITTATLQGLGKPFLPTRNAAISTLLSSVTVVALSHLFPSLGIMAAILAVMTGIGSGAILGLVEVLKATGGTLASVGLIMRGAIASAAALFVALNVLDLNIFGPLWRILWAGLAIAAVFYMIAFALKLHRE